MKISHLAVACETVNWGKKALSRVTIPRGNARSDSPQICSRDVITVFIQVVIQSRHIIESNACIICYIESSQPLPYLFVDRTDLQKEATAKQ